MPLPQRYCFLCASDEGVFLDIAEENRAEISQQLETCSLHPENSGWTDESFKQICHKCTYELRQCSSFVARCEKTLNAKKKSKIANKACCLCLSSGNKLYLFDLEKDNYSLETPIYKIKNFFNHDIYEDKNRLICLSCRYILDVLYDLNKIYRDNLPKLQNIRNEELNYSQFPKTRTRVVNRKTTTTESNSISAISISSSDSEFSIMPRKKESKINIRNRKSLPKSDLQSCTECKNTYSSSKDVYRIHKSGHTVCKKCWLTIDPSGHNDIKASADTKVCSVFVKDVLRDSTYKKHHVYKVKEDSNGHKTYIITEPPNKEKAKSSQSKTKSGANKASIITESQSKEKTQYSLRKTKVNGNKASSIIAELKNKEKTQPGVRTAKRTTSLDESGTPEKNTKVYATRRSKTSAESADSDEKTIKKQLQLSKYGNNSKVSNNEKPVPMRRTRNQVKNEENAKLNKSIRNRANQSKWSKESVRKAASDTEQITSKRKSGRNRKRTIASRTDASEDSSNEVVLSKKRKLISFKTETNDGDVVDKTSAGDSSSSDIEIISVTDASDETNDIELKSEALPEAEDSDELSKSRREKRAHDSEPPVETANKRGKSKANSKKDVKGKRARSTSASSNEAAQSSAGRKKQRENTPPSQAPVTLDIIESPNAAEATTLEEDKPYNCKICDKSFESKLLGLTHEISHHKQLEVKLHRRKLEDESEAKDDADDKEARIELEETSENIAIRLDDDEDTDVDTLSKPEKEDTDIDTLSKPEKEDTDDGVVSKPEKVDSERTGEVKEDAPPQEDSPSEAPNDTEIKEDTTEHNTSRQKADVVDSSSVDTDKIKTPEVVDDTLMKNVDFDVKDDSDKSNSDADKQKDINKKVDLPKESTEKFNDSAEKDQQVDSTEADKLTEIDVESTEINTVNRDVLIVEASDDVLTETLAEDMKENGDISSEKVKSDAVEEKKFNSSIETLTKNINNSETNAKEGSNDELPKPIETITDEAPDALQEAIKENSLEKEVEVSEKKDGCENMNVSATIDSLKDLDESKTNDTVTGTRDNQSEKAATEVLQEVFDLAAAEVQKRHDSSPKSETENQEDVETLENISREIQNSADLKPLNSNRNSEVSLD